MSHAVVEAKGDAQGIEIDLSVDAGEVVGLIGPNGAGKTSTLATLGGLRRLDSGEIRIRSEVVDGAAFVPPHRRRMGWAPQVPALLPGRRPRAQVQAFASDRSPLSGQDLLERLDVPDRRHLSHGQQQRTSLARALAASEIALLDEPTSAQDSAGAAASRRLILEYAAAGGSVILAAHLPEDAYALADRLVVIETGEVVQKGKPDDLATNPATSYVARVVGATVLEGTVKAGRLEGLWGSLTCPDGTEDGPSVAMVRPASVTISLATPGGSARNIWPCRVRSLNDGPQVVTVALDGSPSLVAALTHAATADLGLRVGSEVWAAVKANDIQVTPR